jgi:C-terminal processing protease CtpA/Prc
MTADGTPIEGRGVLPDVVVDLPAEAYTKADPTWQRAVELLREGIKKSEN